MGPLFIVVCFIGCFALSASHRALLADVPCYGEGMSCDSTADIHCCEGLKCETDTDNTGHCSNVEGLGSRSLSGQCAVEGEYCDDVYCCEGFVCPRSSKLRWIINIFGFWHRVCEEPDSDESSASNGTSPESTPSTSQCVGEGQYCSDDVLCCEYMECPQSSLLRWSLNLIGIWNRACEIAYEDCESSGDSSLAPGETSSETPGTPGQCAKEGDYCDDGTCCENLECPTISYLRWFITFFGLWNRACEKPSSSGVPTEGSNNTSPESTPMTGQCAEEGDYCDDGTCCENLECPTISYLRWFITFFGLWNRACEKPSSSRVPTEGSNGTSPESTPMTGQCAKEGDYCDDGTCCESLECPTISYLRWFITFFGLWNRVCEQPYEECDPNSNPDATPDPNAPTSEPGETTSEPNGTPGQCGKEGDYCDDNSCCQYMECPQNSLLRWSLNLFGIWNRVCEVAFEDCDQTSGSGDTTSNPDTSESSQAPDGTPTTNQCSNEGDYCNDYDLLCCGDMECPQNSLLRWSINLFGVWNRVCEEAFEDC